MPRKNGRTRTSTTGGAGMVSAQIGETSFDNFVNFETRTFLTILASAQIGPCAESGFGDECFFVSGVSMRLTVKMNIKGCWNLVTKMTIKVCHIWTLIMKVIFSEVGGLAMIINDNQ